MALTYAGRFGWQALPLDGKQPATDHGFKDAEREPERVRSLWRERPEAGVGIATGEASGLLVLDVDPDKGGDEVLAELERQHGKLPDTVEALTGGGGRHIYFHHADGVGCSAGKLGPGLDIRADGGYVVAPPSRHPSGRPYEWEVSLRPGEVEVADPPAWLLDLLHDRRNGSAARVGEAIPEGGRNATLASLGGTMRRRGMGETEIRVALVEANRTRCKPPLPEAEVKRIAASVARYDPAPRVEVRHGEEPQESELVEVRIVSAEKFGSVEEPGAESIIGEDGEAVIPEGGDVMIYGDGGSSKTTLAVDLASTSLPATTGSASPCRSPSGCC